MGPPLAGAFIVAFSTGAAFVIDSVSFFVAAAIVLLISGKGAMTAGIDAAQTTGDGAERNRRRRRPAAAEAQPSFLTAIRDGIRYVLADSPLAITLLLSMILNFALNGPAAVGMPWLAEIRFDAGTRGARPAERALGRRRVGRDAHRGQSCHLVRPGRILLASVAVAGVAMLVVAVAPVLALAMVALAVMGLMVGFVNIVAISWLQARIAQDMLGRVMSLAMLMGFGITPLSLGVAGALLDVNATLLFVGAGVLVVGRRGRGGAVPLPVEVRRPVAHARGDPTRAGHRVGEPSALAGDPHPADAEPLEVQRRRSGIAGQAHDRDRGLGAQLEGLGPDRTPPSLAERDPEDRP